MKKKTPTDNLDLGQSFIFIYQIKATALKHHT